MSQPLSVRPPDRPRELPSGWLLAMIAMLLIGFALATWWNRWLQRPLHDARSTPRPVTPRGDLAQDEQSTIELFRTQSSAVVFITTGTLGLDLRYLDQTVISRGSGSGFIWSEDGYVVTNDHVIAEASFAQVTLVDQSVWKAKRVGRASAKDLAVLKIDAPPDRLQPILLGQSHDLRVGQKVFAIGNPFGLDQTLTTGIISALDREITANEQNSDGITRRTIGGVIQTDAAINPGNSGGPLLDSHGRLIGVNTAIYSPSGAYAGVGFAIPVDTVNRVVPELIRHGRLIRPDVGIVPFTDQKTRKVNSAGVLVRDVYPGSPAAQAGIQGTDIEAIARGFYSMGDLIVGADGARIEDLDDWYSFLERHKVGDQVTLSIVRNLGSDQQSKLDVTLRLAESME